MADDLLTSGGETPLQPGTTNITDERLMEIANAVYTPTVWSDTLVQGTPDIPGKMNSLEHYIATLTEVNRDMALAVIALRDSVSRGGVKTTPSGDGNYCFTVYGTGNGGHSYELRVYRSTLRLLENGTRIADWLVSQ